ncbi:MAG: glycosyltransferase family 4 protein [Endomicrobiaceae bacterium]|nr:glycosyltransferase family 4 protein [Endomicrobiaceae bacterium]
MNKKKVLFIFSSFSFGGAEKMTADTASAINKFSNEFEAFVATPKESPLSKYSNEKQIKTLNFNCRGTFTPTGILKLFKIIKKEKIDIIHVQQGKLFWTALLMKLFFCNVKVVLHRTQDTRHKWYARYHYRIADKVLAVSDIVKNNMIEIDKAPAKKVQTLYNGFDFDNFRKDIDISDIIKEYGLENKIVIGAVGAMVSLEGKGQIYLMQALAKMRNQYPNLICILLGDGPGKKEQEEYAKKLGIGDKVIFAGYKSNIAKYINAMDIFCLLSCDTEGFGNVNIEAQSLAKPVITTNIGGIPETVIENKTALIVNPRDVEALIVAIKKLLDNKNYALDMGAQGKKFVENKFSDKIMAGNLSEIYKEILQ